MIKPIYGTTEFHFPAICHCHYFLDSWSAITCCNKFCPKWHRISWLLCTRDTLKITKSFKAWHHSFQYIFNFSLFSSYALYNGEIKKYCGFDFLYPHNTKTSYYKHFPYTQLFKHSCITEKWKHMLVISTSKLTLYHLFKNNNNHIRRKIFCNCFCIPDHIMYGVRYAYRFIAPCFLT